MLNGNKDYLDGMSNDNGNDDANYGFQGTVSSSSMVHLVSF
jgi:hypothetical protein